MKKLFYFGLIKKALLIFLFLFTSSYAEGDYSGVHFTDYEENATVYLCNYYSQGYLKDILQNNNTAKNIVDGRFNSRYTSVSDIDKVNGVNKYRLARLRDASHLIDWNSYTDDFGMTLHQTNFIYALTGALIGFGFFFFSILIIVTRI